MIGLTTLSLLAACPHAADGASVSPRPTTDAAAAAAPRGQNAARHLPDRSRPEASAGPQEESATLPERAGPWVRSTACRRITEDTIFDYMDGAGELYLAYRFSHLDVCDYEAPEASLGTIQVELYWMTHADDAFGLLSTDWGGEPVDLRGGPGPAGPAIAGGAGAAASGRGPSVPPHDALYGGGLLRFWSGSLYGRIMATRESPDSRAQVLAIATSIVSKRPANEGPPAILSRVPPGLGREYTLRPDRTCFFRSHYILNSVYYLAPDDVLGFGPAVDAAMSEFRSVRAGVRPLRLVQILYPSPDAAAAALRTFLGAVQLPTAAAGAGAGAQAAAAKSDGGWTGWAAGGRALAIVLDAAAEADAKKLAAAALAALVER